MWFANARRHQKNKDKLTRELKNNHDADEDSKSECCSVATEEVLIYILPSPLKVTPQFAILQYEGSNVRENQPNIYRNIEIILYLLLGLNVR